MYVAMDMSIPNCDYIQLRHVHWCRRRNQRHEFKNYTCENVVDDKKIPKNTHKKKRRVPVKRKNYS